MHILLIVITATVFLFLADEIAANDARRIPLEKLSEWKTRFERDDAEFERKLFEREKGVGPTQCEDKIPECAMLRANGFCEPQYYFEGAFWNSVKDCLKTCELCHIQDPRLRCDPAIMGNVSTENALFPGKMDAMFQRIAETWKDNVTVLSSSPWLLQFSNFLTPHECDTLIALTRDGLKRSLYGTQRNRSDPALAADTYRTSQSAFCNSEMCLTDLSVVSITRRIANLVGVPKDNFEDFQVVRYLEGEKYDEHHDYSSWHVETPYGPRILTFFIYLSDVEKGGETSFPYLKLKVSPKRGNAILWPSTLSANPVIIDPRTQHAALPVEQGIKWGANVWIHLRNRRYWGGVGCDLTGVSA